jgi:hypothetical protein
MRLFISLIIGLSLSTLCYGSHVAGGSITWEQTANGQFIFTLELIRDCSSTIITIPALSQTISAPSGSIVVNYDPLRSGVMNLSNCSAGSCASGFGFEKYVYRSNPITVSGPIPVLGAEYSFADCCFRILENTNSSNIYISSVMYPSNGSGVPNHSAFNASVSAVSIDGLGPRSINFGNYYLGGNVDSVRALLSSPWTGASSPISWSAGYNSQSPLPSQLTSPLNGPFNYNTNTGIASVDINDPNAMDEHYIVGVDHLYYANGALVARVKKIVPA